MANFHEVHCVLDVMSLPFSLTWVVQDPKRAKKQIQSSKAKVAAYLNAIDHQFSTFRPDSDVNRYRQDAGMLLSADRRFQSVFAQTVIASQKTEGLFNAWYAGSYDPTGLVKGWAVEGAHATFLQPLLADPNFVAVGLNGGGDMQLSTGGGTDFMWHVGIKDPLHKKRLIASYALKNGAVATSGFSERGRHIVQPPGATNLQATIIGAHLTVADMWATAAMAATNAQFQKLVAKAQLSGLLVTAAAQQIPFSKGRWVQDAEKL